MTSAAYITTSWDDGHPLDWRIADLLSKYGLRGTFYVPQSTEHGTMTSAQLRDLSGVFEIGAHTIHHIDLTGASEKLAWQEMVDSKAWIEDCTGRTCSMFCPPMGKYTVRHAEMIRNAGFRGMRSVELLSLDEPRHQSQLHLMPTTVPAHPHGMATYARNVIKRAALRNLWLFVVHGRSTDWTQLSRSLLCHAIENGGVFHLWGHSWELEQTGQWQRLAGVLRFMGEHADQAKPLDNGQICQRAMPQLSVAGAPCNIESVQDRNLGDRNCPL